MQKKLYEKNYLINDNYEIKEILKKAKKQDLKTIRSFKVLDNLQFIEFPKEGFVEMKKIMKSISKLNRFSITKLVVIFTILSNSGISSKG